MTQRYIDLAFDDTSPRSFGGFNNENEATVIRLKVLDPDAKYYIEIEQACGKHDKYCSDVLPIADGYAIFEVSRDFTHETLYVQGVMKVNGMCRKTARVRVGFSHSINALDELPESQPSWADSVDERIDGLEMGMKDAVTYTPQTLTEAQQKQARTNIGAGQPVFVVNITEGVDEDGRNTYTADKTAAEIEAAYQAGRTIVCKMEAFLIDFVPVELPLVSHNQERVFIFAVDQVVNKNIYTISVKISDNGVEPSEGNTNIYEKPVDGIPKSDLEQSVQTSLAKADTAISLGLTAATPGQIIKVKTVQDGKPTEWETVDGATQPDWNQNDSTQPDYVKNRPFYTGNPVETVLVEESTVTFAEENGVYTARFPSTFEATVGETYKVYWDGTVYECTCVDFNNIPVIGNLSIIGAGSDTGEPFVMMVQNGVGIIIGTADTSASHTFSISGFAPEVVKIDKKYLVQPDWNQNDSTQPDYIKNRPFYTGDPVETVLVEESTVSFSFSENHGLYMAEFPSTFAPTVGETYRVSWDGAAYECTCVPFDDMSVIGNLSIAGLGSDTGEPFVMGVYNGQEIVIITADTSASHTFSISGFVPEVVKIDEKYLPNTVATKSEVEAAQSTADTAQSTADTAQSTADTAQSTADVALNRADTAKTTADTAKTTADAAKSTADGCVKINNSGDFRINIDDNGYFSGGNSNGELYYSLMQKNATDTPIVLGIGTPGGRALYISVTPSTSPTVKITPPVYMNKTADIEISSYADHPRPQITGLGGIIMYSSTSGSTKKFRITVDDSGALTATEVS